MPRAYFPVRARTPRDARSPTQYSHQLLHLHRYVEWALLIMLAPAARNPLCSLLPRVLNLITAPPGIAHKETFHVEEPNPVRYCPGRPIAYRPCYNIGTRT